MGPRRNASQPKRPGVFQQTIILGLVLQIILFAAAAWYCFPSQGLLPTNHSAVERFLYKQQQQQLPQQYVQEDFRIRRSGSNQTLNNFSPLTGLIRSYPNSAHHDPSQKRRCLAFTAVPKELDKLLQTIQGILGDSRLAPILDCIHLTIPDRSIRYSTELYPTTQALQRNYTDPRLIITRTSFDYGPMTRYLGPLHFERHPHTTMILFDVDTNMYNLLYQPAHDLALLFLAADKIDPSAVWCWQGENFQVDDNNVVHAAWDTYPLQAVSAWVNEPQPLPQDASALASLSLNQCHFCRGVGGLAFKPLHFQDFWWNQSDYHESCFWDDDRWVSYQVDRQGFPLKVLHYNDTLQLELDASSRGWFDLSKHAMDRHIVPPSVMEREVPMETPSERQRKEELAKLNQRRRGGNFADRLRIRQQQAHLRDRERLRREQLAAQDAMMEEETAKHDAKAGGSADTPSSDDPDKDEQKNDNDDEHNNQKAESGDEDVNDDKAERQRRQAQQEALRHRRLGSLTQITKSLLSDQTCPLAWLSYHQNAYPSARTTRTDPNVPPPPEDLDEIRKKLKPKGMVSNDFEFTKAKRVDLIKDHNLSNLLRNHRQNTNLTRGLRLRLGMIG